MTKKKPGAVRGRPRTIPEGRRFPIYMPDEMIEVLDVAAAEEGTDRSAVLRAIVGRWMKRRAKR